MDKADSHVTEIADIGCGIDIGGTGIKGALVDLHTGTLASERFRLDTPKDGEPEELAETVREVAAQLDYDGPIGVTFPGVITRGVVQYTANLSQDWLGVSVQDKLQQVVNGPLTILNDADAAGVAEARYGAGQGQSGLVIMVTLGTGIGTALMYDGNLIPNVELGHIEIDGHDAETRASAAARERLGLSWKAWAGKVEQYLQQLEQLMWPELFIIGGGVSKQPDKWFDRIETNTPKVIAKLINNAGIVGGAYAAATAAKSHKSTTEKP